MAEAQSEYFSSIESISSSEDASGLYYEEMTTLFNVCFKSETTHHPTSYGEACARLIKSVRSYLEAFSKANRPVLEFKIGRTVTNRQSKSRPGFKPDKVSTWNTEKGIVGEWGKLLEKVYEGVAILACVDKDLVPSTIQDVIKLRPSDASKKKGPVQCSVDHVLYTQGLVNAVIQHFMFVEPDFRIRNSLFDQQMWSDGGRDSSQVEVIYMAVKLDKLAVKVLNKLLT